MPTEETERLKVTRHDVEDALLIAEIIGGYYTAFPKATNDDEWVALSCLVNFMNPDANHCPTCTCKSDQYGRCGHMENSWPCVAAALNATPEAEMLCLWMRCAFFELEDPPEDRSALGHWIVAFVDKMPCIDVHRAGALEIAAMLRDGLLPPGIVVVTRPRKSSSKKGSR